MKLQRPQAFPVTLATQKEGGLGIPGVPVTLATRKEGGLGIPVRLERPAAGSVQYLPLTRPMHRPHQNQPAQFHN